MVPFQAKFGEDKMMSSTVNMMRLEIRIDGKVFIEQGEQKLVELHNTPIGFVRRYEGKDYERSVIPVGGSFVVNSANLSRELIERAAFERARGFNPTAYEKEQLEADSQFFRVQLYGMMGGRIYRNKK